MDDPLDPLARRPARARTTAPSMDVDPLAALPVTPGVPAATGRAGTQVGTDLGADHLGTDHLGTDPEAALDLAADADLTDEDRDLLVALAAFQLRYGEDAEALAYLLAARAVFPGDADVLRLLAHALARVGRTDDADEVLTELERLVRPMPAMALLSRALVRLAQGRGGEARRLFAQYRERAADRRSAA